MAQYLISVLNDSNDLATAEEMAAIDDFNEQLTAKGHWVFAGGLASPETATVIDGRDGDAVLTDGPYLESKEYIVGFWVIDAPDLDVALRLASQGSKHCNRRVEVRPFAMGQRITRAKAKIKAAKIPYRVPSREDLAARVTGVLTVLYLIFNEGYLASGPGKEAVRSDLTTEAIRLTRLVRDLMPADGEVAGLLALMLLMEARRAARRSRWRRLRACRWRAITSSTPPAPTCCAGWAAARSRGRHTAGPSGWPATPPRRRTSSVAAISWPARELLITATSLGLTSQVPRRVKGVRSSAATNKGSAPAEEILRRAIVT